MTDRRIHKIPNYEWMAARHEILYLAAEFRIDDELDMRMCAMVTYARQRYRKYEQWCRRESMFL